MEAGGQGLLNHPVVPPSQPMFLSFQHYYYLRPNSKEISAIRIYSTIDYHQTCVLCQEVVCVVHHRTSRACEDHPTILLLHPLLDALVVHLEDIHLGQFVYEELLMYSQIESTALSLPFRSTER